jgi:hypothetical protein
VRISSAVLVQLNGWQRSFQPSMNASMAADQVGHGGEGAAADGLSGDDAEEDLNRPGNAGGC